MIRMSGVGLSSLAQVPSQRLGYPRLFEALIKMHIKSNAIKMICGKLMNNVVRPPLINGKKDFTVGKIADYRVGLLVVGHEALQRNSGRRLIHDGDRTECRVPTIPAGNSAQNLQSSRNVPVGWLPPHGFSAAGLVIGLKPWASVEAEVDAQSEFGSPAHAAVHEVQARPKKRNVRTGINYAPVAYWKPNAVQANASNLRKVITSDERATMFGNHGVSLGIA
mmetsp:Transcript_5654/g.13454  ORF Transcript_5654/g.13454 Transcript_5654/m.13454 type:complete len:222 (-) Transcript_5654:710-1375(-)